LTATASFDVLADVQRELNIGEEAIIQSKSMERPELHLAVKFVKNCSI
jgi:superfamily II DNA helicase RecQ